MSFKEYKFDDICELITDGSHTSPKSVQFGKYMASVKDMGDYGFNFHECRKISEEDYNKLVKLGCSPQKGDILIGKDGARYLEDVFIYNQDEEVVLLSSIAIMRVKQEILYPHYLYYFLCDKENRKFIKSNYGSGSAIPRMVLKDFRKVPISIPSREQQKLIIDILLSLDEKIEVNNKINKTLEAMAQEIFKHWFVDFEFPNEDGEPYKSSVGEMVESELGLIPKGWEVGKMNTIADVRDYVANGSFASLKENVKYLEGSSGYAILIRLVDYNNNFSGPFVWTDKKGYAFLNKSKLFGGEIIVSNVGANAGTVFKAPKFNLPMTLGPNSIMIAFNRFNNYLYYYLCGNIGQEKLEGIKSGSAQPKFNKTDFRNIDLIIPSELIIDRFNKVINPISVKIETTNSETKRLLLIRDTLLPKLMSGEIIVPLDQQSKVGEGITQ